MAGACLSLELLEQLVRAGVIAGADGVDADRHLRACSDCRSRLAEMREQDAFIAAFSQRSRSGSQHDDSRASALHDDFPGYSLEAIVEVGGQGAIHRARQLATGRVVAIKVPLGDGVRHPARRYRFRREIELTSRLDHPGIVRVLGVCTAPDGRIGCVMEFVEGERFDEWAAQRRGEGREGVRRIIAAASSMAEAIDYAHSRGVLHRDLKPSNVLVTAQGQPRLLDFGLAKAVDGEVCSFVTMTGAFLGTLAYAAPEQIDGRNDQTEIRTDVYALGLVLYQALAGRVPWDADAAPPELCAQIRQGAAPRPTSLGGARDAELDAIVLKAIATQKERRYPTAALLAEDLERWLAGRPVRARFDSRWYVVRKTAWRKRWWIGAAAVVLGAVGTLIGLALAARSASTRAELAEEIRGARELESHWATIADTRAAARDDLSFGERRAWDALLGSDDALVAGGLEGIGALGQPSEMPGRLDPSGMALVEGGIGTARLASDWVPSSPAYWALWEMYVRTPVVASLPEVVAEEAVFEPGTDRVLVARRGGLERWDWRRGRLLERIDLPLTARSAPTHLLASRGMVALPLVDGTVLVVDLASNVATLVPTQRRGGARLTTPYLAVVVDGDAGRDSRNVLELWRVDVAPPQLMWSRVAPFPIALHVIEESGEFVVAASLGGDLVAFAVPTGTALFTRGRDESPRFQWIASRGRPGEVLVWGDRALGSLEQANDRVALTVMPDRVAVAHAGRLRNVGVAPNGATYAVGLDRRAVAIGHAQLPIEALMPIPALRVEGTPSLAADERHLLVRLDDDQRRAILDLESTAITRISQPTAEGLEGGATIFAVAFDDDGAALLTAAMDGSLRDHPVPPQWATSEDEHAPDLQHLAHFGIASSAGRCATRHRGTPRHGLTCFARDGETVYLGTHELGRRDAKLLWQHDDRLESLVDGERSWYCGVALEPEKSLWALGGDGRLFKLDLATRTIEIERTLPGHPKCSTSRSLARLAHRGLLLAGPGGRGLHLLDDMMLEPVCESVSMPPLRAIAVSPTDPDLFVTTHDSGVVKLWRVTGGVDDPLANPRAGSRSANRSPLRVEFVLEMGAHAGPVFCAAFHPSGRILATGGGAAETRDVRLWDVRSGRELAALSLFEGGVFSVAFSPDGRWLAAGGEGVPGRLEEGGQLYLIDLMAAERCIAGNLEYHIARWTQSNGGTVPPQAEVLRRRFVRRETETNQATPPEGPDGSAPRTGRVDGAVR